MNLPWIATADQLPPDNEAFIGWWPDIGPSALTAKRNRDEYITAEGFEPECAPTHWFAITPPAATAQVEMTCESCAGAGQTFHGENYELEKACITCFGTGKVRKEKQ